MKIELKKLTLTNFKGIRSKVIHFAEETNILGANGSGKTTVMDAFLWLFFGKDSTDRKDFEIKTLGPDNEPYHHLSHEVEGVVVIDGVTTTLKRTYSEKWTKKRGEKTAVMDGHDYGYYWNEVPMQLKEFSAKIAGMFNENIFKLITNTGYYNSLKWQDRRKVLLDMAGAISDVEVLKNIDGDTSLLSKALSERKNIDEFKREIYEKKKRIKDELILIPSRIDEVNRTMPERRDYSQIERNIDALISDRDLLDGMIADKSKAQKEAQSKVIELMNKKQNLSRLMLDIEFSEKQKVQKQKHDREQAAQNIRLEREGNIRNRKRELSMLTDKLNESRSDYSSTQKDIEQLKSKSDALRVHWKEVTDSSITFDEAEFCCPTCKRDYPDEQVLGKKSELTENFNRSKSDKLATINAQGMEYKAKLEALSAKLGNIEADALAIKANIASLESSISEIEKEHERLTAEEKAIAGKPCEADDIIVAQAIAANAQYQQAKADREALELEISAPVEVEDNSALFQRKSELQQKIDALKSEVADKGLRERQQARLSELQSQEEVWSQELADLEGAEFTIEQFTKAKMDILEERINGKFSIVKFKMFDKHISGGESEACETLINGVPYSDANTASKVAAGVDIINALSDHYNFYGPIFVDNRESVTKLPATKSQIVNLIVSPEHKELSIQEPAVVPQALELFS